MPDPRCGTCGDSTADAEFCIIPACPHRGPKAAQSGPTLPHPRAGATPTRDARSPELGRRLGGGGLEFLALFAVEVLAAAIVPVGVLISLLGAVYFAVRDLDGGRYSVSRRLTRTHLVDAETGAAPPIERVILRNAPMALCFVLAIIPGVELLGWLGMVGLSVLDLLLVMADPRGRRLGDRLAKTVLVQGDAS